MATILLSAAGAAIGGTFGGTAFGLSTAVLGRAIGATLGRVIDQKLLGGGSEVVETGQIERFQLTGASEGTAVGRHYGRLRMGGQVIWSTLFKESVKTEDVGGKGGGGSTATTKTYSYSVSLAVALCEGEILGVGRIWADGMEVSREDVGVRVYTGSESQLPDPKIEAIEGSENAPAYRGLAYVIFEDLQLSQFGNRVPQFSFEVLRPTNPDFVPEGEQNLSKTVRAVALIPGTGEYSLSERKINYTNGFGWSEPANLNSNGGKTDLRASLDQLATELPLCNSVSLVVSWFGNDLRCRECEIVPKVEQTEYDGDKMAWVVSDLPRESAQEVPRRSGRPVYGGTPADRSVIEAIKAIKADGKSVVFYPFILMDQVDGNDLMNPWNGAIGQPSFPWRGRITTKCAPGVAGSTDGTVDSESEVEAFFGSAQPEDFKCENESVGFQGDHEWSFRRFILHYAHLCVQAGGVDAFCIGSELRGLTQIRAENNRFPAVEKLVTLARDVRGIVGPDTKISYAADWSEYFGYHPQDGSGDVFFHLDPLWGSDDVDFVGIDNYMPLSDWRDGVDHADAEWKSIYNADYLKANIAGGEGYDWYYADDSGRDAQDRLPITDGLHGEHWIFRYKDLRNWWSQQHRDRVGGVRKSIPTAWEPQSKPIWFTEIGCAAIDKGTNQPNKFVDPKSSESQVPWFSSGLRDDFIQMQYIRATYQFWENGLNNPVSAVFGGRMVDASHAHVWAWDARPYPDFPARTDVWSDGENYRLGHWLNGRATSESLAAVVADICGQAGVTDIDVSELYGLVRGYRIDETTGARSSLQPLELAYGFDASEHGGLLRFKSRNGIPSLELNEETFVGDGEAVLSLQRSALGESAGRVRVNYIQADSSFETRTTEASLPDEENSTASASDLAICLTDTESKRIGERWLAEASIARDTATFSLPPSYSHVQVGDVVELTYGDRKANYRVDRMDIGEALEIEAVRVEPDLFRPSTDVVAPVTLPSPRVSMPVFARLLDLPLISGNEDPVAPYIAAYSSPWPGAVAVYSSSEDEGYSLNSIVEAPSVVGVTETTLKEAAVGVPDLGACLRVRVYGGGLSSVTRTALLNGANALVIGDGDGSDWEIIQFGKAKLVAEDTYELSYLLRGQLGTDAVMPSEWPAGSKVVVLDSDLSQIELASSARGLERHYRIGPSDKGYADDSFVHVLHSASSAGLRPYTPVHLKADPQSDGSLHVKWVRRTRIDGDSWEGLEVPLGETAEQYLVRVVQGDSVLREAETAEPNWRYDAEMRTTDAPSGAFEIRVAQLSERYGVGPFQRIEINE